MDDWIVDPDEAAAEANMKLDTDNSYPVYGALGEKESRLLAALTPAESPRSVQKKHLMRLSRTPLPALGCIEFPCALKANVLATEGLEFT